MDIAALKNGKELMKQRCIECAVKNTPALSVPITYRKSLSGCVRYNRKTKAIVSFAVPQPFTRRALHVYLHECAHVALSHRFDSKPRHVEELEAEQWAFARMREANIPVSRKSLQRAKEYVSWKIEQAVKRGAKSINSEAAVWSGYGGNSTNT